MKLKDLIGTAIPYMGWREHTYEDVQDFSEVVEGVSTSRRYSGFQIAWLGLMFVNGLKDIGPRE